MYNIAVCEDEERDLEIVKQLLELYGARHEWKYALKTYDTAKNFIRDMERMKSIPDIVFLDIYLREGNGVEVAKEMRANGFANPRICSGSLQCRRGAVSCKTSGAEAFLFHIG